jgi:hypothetical protein
MLQHSLQGPIQVLSSAARCPTTYSLQTASAYMLSTGWGAVAAVTAKPDYAQHDSEKSDISNCPQIPIVNSVKPFET